MIVNFGKGIRRNPVLVDMFNRLAYKERKGSGFEKVISGYQFLVNYSVESFDISDANLRTQIKESIKENPKVTRRELVGKIGYLLDKFSRIWQKW